jgi:hypothetical protein
MKINNQQFNNNQNMNSQQMNNNNNSNYNNMQQFNDNNKQNRDDSPKISNDSDYYRKLHSLPTFQNHNFSLNNMLYQKNNQIQNNNNNDDNMNDMNDNNINNQYNQDNQDKVASDNISRNERNKQNYLNNVQQDNINNNINTKSDPNYMNYNNNNNEHIRLNSQNQKNINKKKGNNNKEIEDSKKIEANNLYFNNNNNNNNQNLDSNVKDSNCCFNVDTVVSNIISSKSINNSNNNNEDTKNFFINKNEYNDFSFFNSTNRNEEDSINRDKSKYAYPTKDELQDDQGELPSFSYMKDACPEMSVLADDELPKEIHNHQIVKSSLSGDMCIICLKKKSCEKGHICNFCPLIICDKCVKMIITQYYSSDKHRHSLVLKIINSYKCELCKKKEFPNNFCFCCDECNFRICLSCFLPNNKNEDDQIHDHSLLKEFDTSLECKKCGEKKKEGIKCNNCNLELCSDCYNEIIDRNRKDYLHEHKMFLNQTDNWTCNECKKSEGKVAFSCKQCNIDYCLNCFLE